MSQAEYVLKSGLVSENFGVDGHVHSILRQLPPTAKRAAKIGVENGPVNRSTSLLLVLVGLAERSRQSPWPVGKPWISAHK